MSSPSRHGQGSRKPVTYMPCGGVAITGVSSFFQCSRLIVFGRGEHLRLAQLVVAVVQCCLGGRRILHAGVDESWACRRRPPPIR